MGDRIRITSAAQDDLRALLPRVESRAAVLRHMRKLEWWISGTALVLDIEIAGFDASDIKELCLTDCFGFDHGIRAAFFEDVRLSPTGPIWIIGFRRDDAVLTEPKIKVYRARKSLIEVVV